MKRITDYFKKPQENYNTAKNIVQSSKTNNSDSAAASKNTERESSVPPNNPKVVSYFFKGSSISKSNNQLPHENPVASTSAHSVSQKVNKLPSSHGLVRESNPIVNEREENTNNMRYSSIVSPPGNYVSRSDQTINQGVVSRKYSEAASYKCIESSKHVFSSAYSVSQKANKLPSSHGSVRESNPIVYEREDNTNNMRYSSIDKVPHVSPPSNYVSRSDQTINQGIVSRKCSAPASSKCNESSKHVLCEQSVQSVHAPKVRVPNQANANVRTKTGIKKGGLGFLNTAMVEYMELHGDISKCNDKILLIQKWEELTKTLNARTGANRSAEQWKRKWRYLRHHATKKKEDIANGLAGGADSNSTYKLVDLARILKIIESPIVIDVEETDVTPINTHMLAENLEQPTLETQAALPESPTRLTNEHHESRMERIIHADESRESNQVDREEDRPVDSSTYTQQSQVGPQRRRFVRRRLRPTLRRSERSAQADEIAEKFHTLLQDFTCEHFRLRQLELEQQAQNTLLFTRFVELLERLEKSES